MTKLEMYKRLDMAQRNNAKEEYQLAVGAYQMFKRPTRIIGAICNNFETGSIE